MLSSLLTVAYSTWCSKCFLVIMVLSFAELLLWSVESNECETETSWTTVKGSSHEEAV